MASLAIVLVAPYGADCRLHRDSGWNTSGVSRGTENVPKYLEDAYLESDAGIETYSVFEADGHVFGYLEVEDPDAIKAVMEDSKAQGRWDERMELILVNDDDIWLDEVYRMV